MKTSPQLLLLVLLFIFCNSCKKDNENDTLSGGTSTASSKVTTSISGRITDESGDPVSSVIATIDGNTATTDANGIYILKNISVSEGRCVVKLEHSGFVDQYMGLHPYPGEITYANAVIFPVEGSFAFSATSGGTVSLPDGAKAVFPPDAIANSDGSIYSGSVTVKMNYINADDNNLNKKIPGSDLMATDANGESKILLSFGMMNIELYDGTGAKLNLAAGKTAELTFPVASSQLINAPATIPTWHFDTNTGLWKEEGSAVKNGNIYSCSVSHFSWWNIDLPVMGAVISGYAKSCDGSPLANINISLGGMYGAVSNSAGYYKGNVRAGIGPEPIFGSDNNSFTQTETVPTLAVGQNYIVPDLIFNGSLSTLLITGTIADCDNFPVSGLAVITSPFGYWDSQLTGTNGQFAFIVTPGITYTITVSYGGLSNQYTVTPAAVHLCDVFNIGLIPLCSSAAPGNFTFSILTSQFGNQQYMITTNHCDVSTFTQPASSKVALTSFDDASNYTSHYDLVCSNYQSGNYIWNSTNSLEFTMMMNGIPVSIISNVTGTGGNTLIATPSAGGMVEASFDGPIDIYSTQFPGGHITGYISGGYTAFRNY
ncbi:MAG: carboxypeptidase-like regulatory domain-containing protein [Bacteroidota bacterium]